MWASPADAPPALIAEFVPAREHAGGLDRHDVVALQTAAKRRYRLRLASVGGAWHGRCNVDRDNGEDALMQAGEDATVRVTDGAGRC